MIHTYHSCAFTTGCEPGDVTKAHNHSFLQTSKYQAHLQVRIIHTERTELNRASNQSPCKFRRETKFPSKAHAYKFPTSKVHMRKPSRSSYTMPNQHRISGLEIQNHARDISFQEPNAIPLLLLAPRWLVATIALSPLKIEKTRWVRSPCRRGHLHPYCKVKWNLLVPPLGSAIGGCMEVLALAPCWLAGRIAFLTHELGK